MKMLSLCVCLLLTSTVFAQFAPQIDLDMDNLNSGQISSIDQDFTFFANEEGPMSMGLDISQGSFDFTGVNIGDVVGNLTLSVSVAFPPVSGSVVAESQVTAINANSIEAQVIVTSVTPAVLLLLSTLGIADPTGMVAFQAIYENNMGGGASLQAIDQGVLPTGTSTLDLPISWDTPNLFRQAAGGGTTTLTSTLVSPTMVMVNYSEDFVLSGSTAPQFIRGDVSDDGALQINDAVALLAYLFSGAADPSCFSTADVDDNASISIGDAVTLLGFLFGGQAPPPAPGISCGSDPTSDSLTCLNYLSC